MLVYRRRTGRLVRTGDIVAVELPSPQPYLHRGSGDPTPDRAPRRRGRARHPSPPSTARGNRFHRAVTSPPIPPKGGPGRAPPAATTNPANQPGGGRPTRIPAHPSPRSPRPTTLEGPCPLPVTLS
jgi:hypothetical protein